LAREAPLPVRVSGACMLPALADGAQVAVEGKRFYWPGDIVAFEARDARLVVHRVIGYRRGGTLLTQADASLEPDSAVPLSRVLGRVAMRTPLEDRLRALLRFGRFAVARVAARLA
jgi:hypothetical protein